MEKKNTESSEHISSNEVDEIVELEPKKEFDDLVGSDDDNDEVDELTEEEIVGKEDPTDTDEEEKENDSL